MIFDAFNDSSRLRDEPAEPPQAGGRSGRILSAGPGLGDVWRLSWAPLGGDVPLWYSRHHAC